MSQENNDSGGCACCGCFIYLAILVVCVLIVWALFFGLPVNGKIVNIDIFPPAINIESVE